MHKMNASFSQFEYLNILLVRFRIQIIISQIKDILNKKQIYEWSNLGLEVLFITKSELIKRSFQNLYKVNKLTYHMLGKMASFKYK